MCIYLIIVLRFMIKLRLSAFHCPLRGFLFLLNLFSALLPCPPQHASTPLSLSCLLHKLSVHLSEAPCLSNLSYLLPCIFRAPLFLPTLYKQLYNVVQFLCFFFLPFSLSLLFTSEYFCTCLHALFFYLTFSFFFFLILSLSLMNHVEAFIHCWWKPSGMHTYCIHSSLLQ